MATEAAVRSLPAPVIDPEDVRALVPGLSLEDATLYASLATLALEAALWPGSIPAAPLPSPLDLAGLSIATRLASAGAASGSGATVVSESIGSYTYRLATPLPLDVALAFTDAERKLLAPWLGQTRVYDVSVSGATFGWPADWWQRDYDRLEYAPQPDVSPDYLTQEEADALYSKLGHAHARLTTAGWTFSTQTSAADPGSGRLRLNASDPATATEIYLSVIDADGTDWTPVLDVILGGVGDVIRVQDRDDAAHFVEYGLTGSPFLEAGNGWLRFSVSTLTPGAAFANNAGLLVYFIAKAHP